MIFNSSEGKMYASVLIEHTVAYIISRSILVIS